MPKAKTSAIKPSSPSPVDEVHTPSLSEMVRQRNVQRVKDAEDRARLSKAAVNAVTQELKEL